MYNLISFFEISNIRFLSWKKDIYFHISNPTEIDRNTANCFSVTKVAFWNSERSPRGVPKATSMGNKGLTATQQTASQLPR